MQNFNQQFQRQENKVQQSKEQVAGVKAVGVSYSMADYEDLVDKILRQPRSKKYMKALKDIDMPSLTDLEIMERMKKRCEQRGEAFSEESVTQEDVEAFARRCLEEVKAEIQKEKEEEERRLRELEEERRRKEENILLMTLCQCCISGCIIHAIDRNGDVLEHYRSLSELPKQGQLGYQMFREVNCSCVEVYMRRLVAVGSSGNVIEIRRLSDDQMD